MIGKLALFTRNTRQTNRNPPHCDTAGLLLPPTSYFELHALCTNAAPYEWIFD